jgi:hypothetical protein
MPTQTFGAAVTYPTKLKTKDYTARTMEGGCCFGNMRTKIYILETFKEKCLCEKHQRLTKVKYSSFKAKD